MATARSRSFSGAASTRRLTGGSPGKRAPGKGGATRGVEGLRDGRQSPRPRSDDPDYELQFLTDAVIRGSAAAAHLPTAAGRGPNSGSVTYRPRAGTVAPSSTRTGRRWTSTASRWPGQPPVMTGIAVTPARPLLP